LIGIAGIGQGRFQLGGGVFLCALTRLLRVDGSQGGLVQRLALVQFGRRETKLRHGGLDFGVAK
jgi:hypothetical protein